MKGLGRTARSLAFDAVEALRHGLGLGGPRTGGYFETELLRRILLKSRRRNLVYVKVGRSASTSMGHLLYNLEVDDGSGTVLRPDGATMWAAVGTDATTTRAELDDRLFGEGVTRFTVVRHPFDRLVSFYGKATLRKRDERELSTIRRHADPMRVNVLARAGDFGAFADLVAATPDAHLDEHVRPQAALVRFGATRYHTVARFETMKADMVPLVEAVGASPKLLDLLDEPINAVRRGVDWRDLPTPTLDRLRVRYARDAEVFGYDLSR